MDELKVRVLREIMGDRRQRGSEPPGTTRSLMNDRDAFSTS
jgi:hypothetical protein